MSGISTPSDPLVQDPVYPRLRRYLVEATGLAYYEDKNAEFAFRLGRRFAAVGVRDCASYFEILRDPVHGPAEMDALIAEITIGETYFFRHAEHFSALRQEVLPDLIARNQRSRSLRIWSAGCADGPEPYSLSILLKRDFARELVGWNVGIIGTDINRQALARAREGRFEEWALRSVSEEVRRQCFMRQGRSWTVAREYRQDVSFQYHNLVEDSFPSLIHNLVSFDLIVCRNVMIYFAAPVMQRVVRQFSQCLVPGAWMLVGPSEPNMTCFQVFQVRNAPGVTLYRKHEGTAPPSQDPPRSLMPALPPLGPQGVRGAARRPALENGAATFARVRAYADGGAWQEAARCCQDLLAVDGLNAGIHFYYGLILEQLRRHEEAEGCLRRAIYLDRQSVLSHYYLGLMLQSRGQPLQASRFFQNAADLLRNRPDEDSFPEADGVTAGELKKLANTHLDMLRRQALSEALV